MTKQPFRIIKSLIAEEMESDEKAEAVASNNFICLKQPIQLTALWNFDETNQ